MTKKEERENPNSCWNKAKEDEPIFITLGHDIAAPATILEWVHARISYGENWVEDAQIREALKFIEKMRAYRDKFLEGCGNDN